MFRHLCFILSLTFPLFVQAQTGTTGQQGKVTVVQDKAIDDLVYNKKKANTPKSEKNNSQKGKPVVQPTTGQGHSMNNEANRREKSSTNRPPQSKSNKLNQGSYKARQRFKAQGYRIQIYTGGNRRSDKQAAQRMQQKCQKAFPELAAYVHFISPHWVCRVGDFRHKEDAQRYARKIRAKKFTFEARVVSSNILVAQ